jgi:hypothetical protein
VVHAHEVAPAGADRGEVGVARHAEHQPRVVAPALEVARLDAREGALVDAEPVGDRAQEGLLALVVAAVGEGDLEQALEDVLEHPRLVAEHCRDALGVGVEAGDVLAREVEDAGGGGLVGGGDLEHLAEGGDLGRAHEAVGLGHLRPEADDGDGEGDAVLRRAAALEVGKQRLAARDDRGDGFLNAAPERHGPQSSSRPCGAQKRFAGPACSLASLRSAC